VEFSVEPKLAELELNYKTWLLARLRVWLKIWDSRNEISEIMLKKFVIRGWRSWS